MKGIELPINTLIVIVIAMIVLIVIIGMFYNPFTSGTNVVNIDTAKSNACRSLIANNCNIHPRNILVYNYDANDNKALDPANPGAAPNSCGTGATSGDNLWSLCICRFSISASDVVTACKQCMMDVCGCESNVC